jgi:hypothetical protein
MNLTTLKTELAARGFDYLSDTRQGQYVNWARAELDDTELWPYRVATATGAAPLTIATLGPILSVRTTVANSSLDYIDPREILSISGDITAVGTAMYYTVAQPTIVTTYPASTSTLRFALRDHTRPHGHGHAGRPDTFPSPDR